MNSGEYLLAERAELQRILENIPPGNAIDRASFRSRLARVERELSEIAPSPEPAKARLRFRGKPVVGSHGIFAEFGLSACKEFAETVSAMAASFFLARPLAASGRIPDRELYQLLVTGPALGSFGFEFEEHEPIEGESAVATAIDYTQNLLQGSVGSDEELADAASGIDERVLQKLREFLTLMVNNEATCALEGRKGTFEFRDVGQVRQSLKRLAQENLHERIIKLEGKFEGVLPRLRTFEFRVRESGELITGKIGPGVDDAHPLNRHLNEHARVELKETRVGSGRPRFVLYSVPEWLENPTTPGLFG